MNFGTIQIGKLSVKRDANSQVIAKSKDSDST
jgi:hypothetical protein